jgi:hypothetical protein
LLVRVIKKGPGCVYQPGSLLKTDDKSAMHLINIGFAEAVDPIDMGERITRTSRKNHQIPRVGNPFMLPPRFICGCGYVAKNAELLQQHRGECK